MSIRFIEKDKVFKLDSKDTSYIIAIVDEEQFVGHVYFGKKILDENVNYLLRIDEPPYVPSKNNRDRVSFYDSFPMEYSTHGIGDFRESCLQVRDSKGHTACKLQYISHEIFKGKKELKGLPATFGDENECTTLEITCLDKDLNLEVVLVYTTFENLDVITRSVRVKNCAKDSITLTKVLSTCVDFDGINYDMISLHGSWARERHISRKKISYGKQAVSSNRGESSHQDNPFIALLDNNATDESGNVYGFNFVYSGNFFTQIEGCQFDTTRVVMGINPEDFAWVLEEGQEFITPEVVMVYSNEGIGKMTRTFHDLYRNNLIRGKYKDKKRPILINNWEATYFDFNNEKIKEIAKESSKLGIELFVLDDGWFGERNNDDCSLGDWFVNEEKLKGGLNSLATDINKMGMQFGLWFEPEMISPKSKLYEEHPDWCIHIDGRIRSEARKQLILDLSRDEVCEAVIKMITDVLKSAPISYVKWDMNRNMTEIGSTAWPAKKQKEIAHRYMLGLYKILENITSNFPNILFESCSGGGGRFDGGMLYYMPQTWTSDDTDAIERLMIQEGTSLVYPTSSMGSHVSAVPNHQVHRSTPLNTRGVVAMAGSFGYELDVTKMNEEEKEEVKKQVEFYKNIRSTVQFGDLYRLKSSFDSNEAAWMNLSKDGKEVVVSYVKKYAEANVIPRRLKVKALDENSLYEVIETGEVFGGDELMYIGLEIGELMGDYQAKNWTLRKVD